MKVVQTVFRILAPLAILASSPLLAASTSVVVGLTAPSAPSAPILIDNVSFKGTGCTDESTAAVNISDDKQAFTVSFAEFFAETGPGLPFSAGRKNCILTLDLDIPAGWQYSISSFNFRGYMALDKGVQAEHSATYFLQGNADQFKYSSLVKGAFDKDYVYTDKLGIGTAVWSACGAKRALSINTAVRVWNANKAKFPRAAGLITNDTIDGEIKQVWGLSWRKCKPS